MAEKKTNKKQLSSSERHSGVVLEDIDSKLDLIVEGQQVLDKKIDRHYGEFQEFRKEVDYKFEIVFEGQQVLGGKIDKVDKKVENLRTEMDYKFELTFDELRLIRNELKEKVGRDEFALLEKRIVALEKSRK